MFLSIVVLSVMVYDVTVLASNTTAGNLPNITIIYPTPQKSNLEDHQATPLGSVYTDGSFENRPIARRALHISVPGRLSKQKFSTLLRKWPKRKRKLRYTRRRCRRPRRKFVRYNRRNSRLNNNFDTTSDIVYGAPSDYDNADYTQEHENTFDKYGYNDEYFPKNYDFINDPLHNGYRTLPKSLVIPMETSKSYVRFDDRDYNYQSASPKIGTGIYNTMGPNIIPDNSNYQNPYLELNSNEEYRGYNGNFKTIPMIYRDGYYNQNYIKHHFHFPKHHTDVLTNPNYFINNNILQDGDRIPYFYGNKNRIGQLFNPRFKPMLPNRKPPWKPIPDYPMLEPIPGQSLIPPIIPKFKPIRLRRPIWIPLLTEPYYNQNSNQNPTEHFGQNIQMSNPYNQNFDQAWNQNRNQNLQKRFYVKSNNQNVYYQNANSQIKKSDENIGEYNNRNVFYKDHNRFGNQRTKDFQNNIVVFPNVNTPSLEGYNQNFWPRHTKKQNLLIPEYSSQVLERNRQEPYIYKPSDETELLLKLFKPFTNTLNFTKPTTFQKIYKNSNIDSKVRSSHPETENMKILITRPKSIPWLQDYTTLVNKYGKTTNRSSYSGLTNGNTDKTNFKPSGSTTYGKTISPIRTTKVEPMYIPIANHKTVFEPVPKFNNQSRSLYKVFKGKLSDNENNLVIFQNAQYQSAESEKSVLKSPIIKTTTEMSVSKTSITNKIDVNLRSENFGNTTNAPALDKATATKTNSTHIVPLRNINRKMKRTPTI